MKTPLRNAWCQMLWILSETRYKCILKCSEENQVMSVSKQKTHTGEPRHESKRGSLWHCGILPLPTYLEESETCQHKTSVRKTKGSHGYKRWPSILPPNRTPKPNSPPSFHLPLLSPPVGTSEAGVPWSSSSCWGIPVWACPKCRFPALLLFLAFIQPSLYWVS